MTTPRSAVPARVGLGAVMMALTIDVAALSVDIVKGNRLRGGASIDTVGLDFSSTLSTVANVAVLLAVLMAAAGFGWWFLGCYRRLAAVGMAGLPSWWAVVAWVVPLLNLVRPPAMMRELAEKPADPSQVGGLTPILVLGWWILFIEGAVIQVGLRLLRPETAIGWSNWQWAALLSDLILMASVACAIALVAVVNTRQAGLAVMRPTMSRSLIAR